MNLRKKNITKIATMYGVLSTVLPKGDSILIAIDRLIGYYIYNPDNGELKIIKDTIFKLEKKFDKDNTIIDLSVVLNMLDQILEDEKLYVKYQFKLYAINYLQNLVLTHPEYKAEITDLDKAEEVNNLINEVIE